ncbi:MAG: hypothetical protein CMG71_08290 [Candidatus Marinimicrobia bacterium]|nr:hypothetical protein [Candidatus Neomarinimicrobiota bacterium]|tara:strand:+ start:130 stop:1032 length:903 start_codon:yes stop_codon:yes gene_type:complete
MSILNTASDGLYNVLIVLCGVLDKEGGTEKDKLINICSNKEDASVLKIRQTLLRWTQLGLFVENNGVVDFGNHPNTNKINLRKKGEIMKYLPVFCRQFIFSEDNNKNFWDSENSKAADINRALSWILAQNIYNFSLHKNVEIQKIESKQLNDNKKRLVQNSTRLNGLKNWAPYLGFTSTVNNMIVDPTRAIIQESEIIFEEGAEYVVNDFLRTLAGKLPVLDGGTYRQRVEEVLDPRHWQKPPSPEMLSTSLSRALWRLELAGIIELETRSDADANRLIQRQGGQQLKSFTHVIYRGDGQ